MPAAPAGTVVVLTPAADDTATALQSAASRQALDGRAATSTRVMVVVLVSLLGAVLGAGFWLRRQVLGLS